MSLLYHVNMYLEFLILTCTIYILASHTFCTRLAEAGVDLKTMQYLMGHEDVKITLEVYNHVNQELLIDMIVYFQCDFYIFMSH